MDIKLLVLALSIIGSGLSRNETHSPCLLFCYCARHISASAIKLLLTYWPTASFRSSKVNGRETIVSSPFFIHSKSLWRTAYPPFHCFRSDFTPLHQLVRPRMGGYLLNTHYGCLRLVCATTFVKRTWLIFNFGVSLACMNQIRSQALSHLSSLVAKEQKKKPGQRGSLKSPSIFWGKLRNSFTSYFSGNL